MDSMMVESLPLHPIAAEDPAGVIKCSDHTSRLGRHGQEDPGVTPEFFCLEGWKIGGFVLSAEQVSATLWHCDTVLLAPYLSYHHSFHPVDSKLVGGVALGVGIGYALARLNSQASSSAKTGASGVSKDFSGQKPLLVIGSLNADIILEISRFPKQGETLGARSDSTGYMVPGGKGANQAVAAARAGSSIPTCFVSMFGNDSHATALKDSLLSSGVDVSLCMDCDVPSGQAFIFLEEDGQNSILIVGGSNKAFPSNCVSKNLLSAIQGASAVMLQREIPEALNIEVAQAAKKAGVPVIFDMGGEDSPLPDVLLPLLEFVCPNETELSRLVDMPTR
jgi:ribokinase